MDFVYRWVCRPLTVGRPRTLCWFAFSVLLAFPAGVRAQLSRGTLHLRFLRAGVPQSGLHVLLTSEKRDTEARGSTDAEGVTVFSNLQPGRYLVSAGGRKPFPIHLSSEITSLDISLDRPFSTHTERFGRSTLTRAQLQQLPQGGSIGSVLETVEPVAVTNRIDVAGIESGTQPLWGGRGSSWTQNRVLLDGMDLTEPSGGGPLFYPDLEFFEEVSLETAAHRGPAAGPGAELQLTSRAVPRATAGSALFRFTGRALQTSNLDSGLISLGVEPRAFETFPAGRLELGGRGFYGALYGFHLSSRLPRFEPPVRTRLFSAAGKFSRGRLSLLGLVQRLRHSHFGARPGVSPEATVEASEVFHVVQARLGGPRGELALSVARGDLDASFTGATSPLLDLATGALQDAPLRSVRRERTRSMLTASAERSLGRHLLRGGVEWSRGQEVRRERVPGGFERLTVDGRPHAVASYSGRGVTRTTVHRVALHIQDFFLLGRRWRLSPGLRLEASRSGAIRWASLSGHVLARLALTPSGSSELQLSFFRRPHVLTSRLGEAVAGEGLSWIWRRWKDGDGDRFISTGEAGALLRRGGPAYTSLASDLARPHTQELTVGVERRFGCGIFRVSAYHRWEEGLLETVNAGIRDESYEKFFLDDVGPDGVLGTPDDDRLPIFDQRKQLGEDVFVLTHPAGLSSFSQGVELYFVFAKKRLSLALSGRAYRDVATTGTGNEAEQNDTGVMGSLFDDPNTERHARGRLFFDRAFTGKLSVVAEGPRRLELGAAVRYWDGQPFARQLFFPDLEQGFTVVQAFPRGRLRYAFNMTVDLRMARRFRIRDLELGLAVDIFNALNQTLQTEENTRSGDHFREPTAVQPARTVRLEARVRF